jgi:hypothetical protein
MLHRGSRLFQYHRKKLDEIISVKWRFTSQQMIEGDSDGVDVRANI